MNDERNKTCGLQTEDMLVGNTIDIQAGKSSEGFLMGGKNIGNTGRYGCFETQLFRHVKLPEACIFLFTVGIGEVPDFLLNVLFDAFSGFIHFKQQFSICHLGERKMVYRMGSDSNEGITTEAFYFLPGHGQLPDKSERISSETAKDAPAKLMQVGRGRMVFHKRPDFVKSLFFFLAGPAVVGVR